MKAQQKSNKPSGWCIVVALFTTFATGFLLSAILLDASHGRRYVSYFSRGQQKAVVPVVVNTWAFTKATDEGWSVINQPGNNALDAVEKGCNVCEDDPSVCNWSVGFGAKPNEENEVTLDAMLMFKHDVGAVGCIKEVKRAISVARKVMEETDVSFIVGYDATRFAQKYGFKRESLDGERSRQQYQQWVNNGHQPNFWVNGRDYSIPYPPTCEAPPIPDLPPKLESKRSMAVDPSSNHDTIGMVAVDANGDVCAGSSTNGLTYKIVGRVGDAPIPGSGAYADNKIGAAAATGEGDIMLRFNPSYRAVLEMGNGKSPTEACQIAMRQIEDLFPTTGAALVCVNKAGEYGAARTRGYASFPYSVRNEVLGETKVFTV